MEEENKKTTFFFVTLIMLRSVWICWTSRLFVFTFLIISSVLRESTCIRKSVDSWILVIVDMAILIANSSAVKMDEIVLRDSE